jgi:hypothetical protein
VQEGIEGGQIFAEFKIENVQEGSDGKAEEKWSNSQAFKADVNLARFAEPKWNGRNQSMRNDVNLLSTGHCDRRSCRKLEQKFHRSFYARGGQFHPIILAANGFSKGPFLDAEDFKGSMITFANRFFRLDVIQQAYGYVYSPKSREVYGNTMAHQLEEIFEISRTAVFVTRNRCVGVFHDGTSVFVFDPHYENFGSEAIRHNMKWTDFRKFWKFQATKYNWVFIKTFFVLI